MFPDNEAKESFSNAINLNPSNGSYYGMKGRACHRTGEYRAKYDDTRYSEAIDDFTLVI